jgi:hypothetical protein
MRQPVTDAAAIAVEVARIHALAPDGLRRTWRAVFGRTPPARAANGHVAVAPPTSVMNSRLSFRKPIEVARDRPSERGGTACKSIK